MEVIGETRGEDAFAEALRRVRIQGAVFCRPECADPWGVTIGRGDVVYFHIVTAGGCLLELPDADIEAELGSGDLVILPHGDRHSLRDDASTPAPLLTDLPERSPGDPYEIVHLGTPTDSPRTTMVCGGLAVDVGSGAPLLEALPPLLHVRGGEDGTASWLPATLQLVEREVLEHDPGADGVVERLAEILFIQALRSYFQRLEPRQNGWIGGLKDAQIGRAIGSMIRDCGRAWTVEELAATSHLSRSAFATRFKQLTGQAPMAFLRRWRLSVASAMLREGDQSLAEIAHRVGYGSKAAFAKAFKRSLGRPPGEYRASSQRTGSA